MFPKKLHVCATCGKSYPTKSSLTRHSYSHSKAKSNITPFKCDLCDGVFTQLGSLQRHIWNHDFVTPYQCKICKKFRTENAASLEEHKKDCPGQKYRCDECPSTFSSKSGYWTHKNQKHPFSARFQCMDCRRQPFISMEIYENHKKANHWELKNPKFLKVRLLATGYVAIPDEEEVCEVAPEVLEPPGDDSFEAFKVLVDELKQQEADDLVRKLEENLRKEIEDQLASEATFSLTEENFPVSDFELSPSDPISTDSTHFELNHDQYQHVQDTFSMFNEEIGADDDSWLQGTQTQSSADHYGILTPNHSSCPEDQNEDSFSAFAPLDLLDL